MSLMLAAICAALLAYANGANDNFKGVATLFGSGVSDYKKALNWATAATLAGSVAAIWFAAQVVDTFSGRLLVSAQTLATPGYPLAVCAACAATVLLASRIGAPISTTHALAGSLLGAAFAAPESAINWLKAGTQIFLPLAVGPILALVSAVAIYPILSAIRARSGITRESCVCIGEEWIPQARAASAGTLRGIRITVAVDQPKACQDRYAGSFIGVPAQKLIDGLHYLSAGAVSFARGVNDTPKIVAVAVLAAPLVQGSASFIGVGMIIALGGLLGARRVAETMAHQITAMNPGQGLTANLITSTLVLIASPMGWPLSTTHVSCGALFGIGAVTRQAQWRTVAGILAAWLVTLPLAALLGALIMRAQLFIG